VLDGWGVHSVQSSLAILGACLVTWMTRHPPSLMTMRVSMGGGGWTNGQTDGQMDKLDRQTDEQMNRRMDGQMNEWMNRWTDG
jgi:hypothetical protein